MSVKTPPGSDRGTTGALSTKRAFLFYVDEGLCHYSQALVPFGPWKWDRTTIRASRLGDASAGINATKMGTAAESPGGVMRN